MCNRRKLSLEFDEGLHREVGSIQAIIDSPIGDTTGCIAGYSQFKLEHFANVDLVPDLVLKEDNDNHEEMTAITDADVFTAWHNIMEGDMRPPLFFSRTIDINTSYMSDFKESIPDI